MATPTLGRKEKLGSSVRSALNEQLGRIQMKHAAEIELLEDFRNFLKQRSQIEKEYSQNIQRLVNQQLSKRDIKPPPDVSNFNRQENRGVMEIWKAILQKTEELGKRRGSVADLLQSGIAETLKEQKRKKEQLFKRHFEVAQKMISEVLETVKDLTTTKKIYNERWKMCQESRQKFQDADDRLRSSNFKLFESKSALERTQKKCTEKLMSAQKHSTVSRNDYMLCLAQTNSQLTKHFEVDLFEIIKEIDGDMYDKLQEAYVLYAQIEADSANAVKAEFEDLRDQASLLNREYVLECFMYDHSILKDKIAYQFEAASEDKVTAVSKDHGAELYLQREARKCSQELTKLNQSIIEKTKQIKGLQSMTQAYQITPEFSTTDATAEAQQNLFMIQEELRQIEVTRNKINSRLDALQENGIDVNKWLQQAAHTGDQVPGEQKPQEKPQQQSDLLDLNTSLRVQQIDLSQGDGDTTSLRSEALTDALSISSYQSELTPGHCIAMYSYQAQRSDELDIHTDDELEVLEWDDGDGWSKGKNKNGQEGYFPQSYVQAVSRVSSPQHTITSGISSLSRVTVNSKDLSVSMPKLAVQSEVFLRALIDYTAQDDEELSFPEGAQIRLLCTDDNGVDDGWWKGSYEGKVGMFPSVVVEIVSDDHSKIFSSELTPVNSEIFPFPPVPNSPPPMPPVPSYPAPEISTWDLTIAPTIRTQSKQLKGLQSGLSISSPSLVEASPPNTKHTMSSSPFSSSNVRLLSEKDRNDTLIDQSDDFEDSFEDTLQTTNTTQWSSFENLQDDEDDSYV